MTWLDHELKGQSSSCCCRVICLMPTQASWHLACILIYAIVAWMNGQALLVQEVPAVHPWSAEAEEYLYPPPDDGDWSGNTSDMKIMFVAHLRLIKMRQAIWVASSVARGEGLCGCRRSN